MKVSDNKRNRSDSASILLWLMLVLIPAFAFFQALTYLDQSTGAVEKATVAQNLGKLRRELKAVVDDRTYLAGIFSQAFLECETQKKFCQVVTEKMALNGIEMTMVTWNADGSPGINNLRSNDPRMEEWKKAGQSLRRLLRHADFPDRIDVAASLGPLFGRQFYISGRIAQHVFVAPTLFTFDVASQSDLSWLASDNRFAVAIKLKRSELAKRSGLREFVRRNASAYLNFAMVSNGRIRGPKSYRLLAARGAAQTLKKNAGADCVAIGNEMYALEQIGKNTWLLFSQKISSRFLHSGKKALLIILILLLLYLVSGLSAVKLEDYSLLGQISVLLFITAGLPCIFLGFASLSYFSQKKMLLVNEKNQEMIAQLYRIDKGVLTENSRLLGRIYRGIADLRPALLGYLPKNIGVNLFQHHFKSDLLSSLQIVRDHPSSLPPAGNDYQGATALTVLAAGRPEQEIELMEILANQALSMFNEVSDRIDIPADKAYMVEMYMQKPLVAVLRDLVMLRNTIGKVGWGSIPHLFFAAPVSAVKQGLYDHIVLVTFFADAVIRDIVQRFAMEAQKNSWGGELFFQHRGNVYPDEKYQSDRLAIDVLLGKCSTFPPAEPVLVSFRDQNYLFVGLTGNFLKDVSLIALYPMLHIETMIVKEARELVLIWLVVIALIFCLLLIFYLHLLQPVASLHRAAVALEERDFAFRLGDLGNDEFGEMAQIFNSSIADFEELQIASIVQARLVPSRELRSGHFCCYGASLPMAQLGGDYFDFFVVDDSHFVVVLGDVAGHGVGASLIMAMAKAGVICSREDAANPAAVLGRLHQMIHSVRNKMQRKVMTLQYLFVNNVTGAAVYANAGGCSPLLLSNNGATVDEINLMAPVLGGFARSKFSNLELKLEQNSAMVFFTDGFVEVRNHRDEEMGYHGFHQLLRDCRASEARVFYEQVWQRFQAWLGGARCQDDLTIVIVTRADQPVLSSELLKIENSS